MSVRSAWLALTGQNRADTRLALSSAMVPSGNLTSRSGLVPDGGFALQSVSAMQCQISTGRAYVQGVLAQGAYPIAVDAAVPLTIPDGDPQYARIDLVILRVQDDQFDGSGLTQASVSLISGTPAAAPVPPAVPAAALALWQISVPSKASAGTGGITWGTAVTDLRVYTSALGGIVPAGTTTWTPPAGGQYSDLNGLLQRYNGSTWSPVYDPTTLGNAFVCTSTTRPTGVPAGKQVYETDTGRISLWTGSAWVSAYDPNSGYGAWTRLTLPTGWGGSPYFRTAPGARIEFRGYINAPSSSFNTSGIATNLPSNTTAPVLTLPTNRATVCSLAVSTTGSLSVFFANLQTGDQLYLDGTSYASA